MSVFALTSRFVAAAMLAAVLAGPALAEGQQTVRLLAQGYPADGCLTRREAIANVVNGRAVPLRQVRGIAEGAAKGEMINAEMCTRDGQLVYVITVLSGSGRVVYVSLNASTGQLIGTR